MVGKGSVILRCGGREHAIALSVRDVHLLDGRFFAPLTASGARALLGLNFVRGLGAPPLDQVLATHRRSVLASHLEDLLAGLEDHRDLLSYSYRVAFGGRPGSSGGGGVSGFRVRGLFGSVSCQPSGYCDLTLSELAPTGRGRVVEMIDMRQRRELATDDWGLLKVSRRAAEVGWYTQLPTALEWLTAQDGPTVEVLHR